MPDTCYPTQVPPHTLIGGPENLKLLFDDTMSDISHDRKLSIRHGDAWETLRLSQQQLVVLQQQNLAFATHLANVQAVTAAQTGATANEQTVSPVRTGAADSQVQQPAGAVYPANRQSDLSGAVASGAVQTADAAVASAASAQAANLAFGQAMAQAVTAAVLAAIGPILAASSGTGSANAAVPTGK